MITLKICTHFLKNKFIKITDTDTFFTVHAKKWSETREPDVVINELVIPRMSF
jgi:hypothetical protein